MGSQKAKSVKSKKEGQKAVKVSLSLKLTLIVVLLSIIIIVTLSLVNIYWQSENEREIYSEITEWSAANFAESHAALKTLDDNLSSYENHSDLLRDIDSLKLFLNNLTEEYLDILKININAPVDNNLTTIVSTDNNSLGILSNAEYNIDAFENGNTYYRVEESILTIISPINTSTDIAGTYEIIITMFPQELSHTAQIQFIVLISFISILILIFSLLYLLRRAIVKPIIDFRNTARIFGKGDLDARVDIDSKDELGDLATAFNQMAFDLKESRDKIQDYNQILEGLLQQKDEFIGQLGHDLKNPLQPLVGLLPMVIEEESNPKIKETLVVMNENVEYMQDLIFKTLELAKLRSSNIQFDFDNIDLKAEVDHVIATEQISLREHNIKIENNVKDGIIVSADKLRLAEIFKNLITNSVKYTPEGGGKIIIDAEKQDKFVKVSLQDSGIGMTEDQIKKVFDDFYKVDVSTDDYKSHGLGLAISKRIVEKHNGKIWVESPGPGKGSTFYFTLKLGDEK